VSSIISRKNGARREAIIRQQLGKHVYPATNNTSVVFYAVRVVSSTQYAVKGKWAINPFQNFFFPYVLLFSI
jgi:hypothetical protein